MTDPTKDKCGYCDEPGPRCEYGGTCDKPATCHVWMPRWRTRNPDRPPAPSGRIKFMCDGCYQFYHDAMTRPMFGIDCPPHADEDWRPNLGDHLRHGLMVMEHENRLEQERLMGSMNLNDWTRPGDREKYTSAQQVQIAIWRRAVATHKQNRAP